MTIVGVLYLLFEETILAAPEVDKQASSNLSRASKCIIGAQIGLIILAMVVTKSSVASIQAKKGLPLGNQVVGWMILSRFSWYKLGFVAHDWNSFIAFSPFSPWYPSEQQLPPPTRHHLPHFFAHLHHSNNFL